MWEPALLRSLTTSDSGHEGFAPRLSREVVGVATGNEWDPSMTSDVRVIHPKREGI